MPDIRMIAVTGEPIFMLMGKSSAIVAAGPSPGRTPTAVPSAQPISPHMRLTGVKAIWNPCRSPPTSNIGSASPRGTRRHAGPHRRLEEQSPRKRGLQETVEDQVDDEPGREAGGGRHD